MKALLLLNKSALIDQVIKQVKASRLINNIMLTTSDETLDQKLISHFQNKKMASFAGPVNDIVARLYNSCQLSKSDLIIRVWGDCPFVCPDIIDQMIEDLLNSKVSFISNSDIKNRTYPPGLDIEIYTKEILSQMQRKITDPKLREFPIEYIKENLKPHEYKYFYSPKKFDNLHLTVDYSDDLTAAEKIYTVLCPSNQAFSSSELLTLMQQQPELFKAFSPLERNKEYKQYLQQKVTIK